MLLPPPGGKERALALDAFHPRVRQVHFDMADRYEDLARAIQAFERHLEHKLEIVPSRRSARRLSGRGRANA